MAKRTNKTSHVLNLLIQPEEGGQPGGGEEPEAKQPAAEEEKLEEVSLKIQEELRRELEEEEGQERAEEPHKEEAESRQRQDGLIQPPQEEIEGGREEPESFRYVNVMEELVKRLKLDPTQYGVCGCSRCRADVTALMLTTLPAKYVIVQEGAVAPMLNYYESKYKVQLLTAAIKACIRVRDNPHHERG